MSKRSVRKRRIHEEPAVEVVAVVGSGGEEASGAQLAECVEKWNGSEDAVGTGSHVASLHGYTEAWVVRLGPEVERDPETGGDCAVVFPAAQADPEPQFAASVLANGRWRPLSQRPGVDVEQLGELQREALARANARLRPNGTVFGAF
jgi:hypothetical protein